MTRPILFDTCAAIWISWDTSLADEVTIAPSEAEDTPGAIVVSPITAWKISILVARGRIAISHEPAGWFQPRIGAGVELAPMPPEILVASSFPPGTRLLEPSDRILAATA